MPKLRLIKTSNLSLLIALKCWCKTFLTKCFCLLFKAARISNSAIIYQYYMIMHYQLVFSVKKKESFELQMKLKVSTEGKKV